MFPFAGGRGSRSPRQVVVSPTGLPIHCTTDRLDKFARPIQEIIRNVRADPTISGKAAATRWVSRPLHGGRRRAVRFGVQLVRDVDAARELWGCVCVPTMGALHAGHGALIERAVEEARGRGGGGAGGLVVVTVFVNPAQFGPGEDFERYPRTLKADVALCEGHGADVVFVPSVEGVYPAGLAGAEAGGGMPRVATAPGLEDAARPGHFAGVCRVVRRLFEVLRPRAAVFGEKDWQQLQVVRGMVAGEGLGVRIIASGTVRDADGMALSSRNSFLTAAERARGVSLRRALEEGLRAGTPGEAERVMESVMREAGVGVDYAVVRDASTLEAVEEWRGREMRALVAGRVGDVRLLDNERWGG